MLGDTVGAVYVKVLADTSSLKSAIEREGEEDGEAFGDDFDKGLAKRLNKIQFNKVLSVRLEKEAKRMAKRIQSASAGGDVDFKISEKFEDEVRQLSELFAVPLDEVSTMVSNRLAGAFDRALDDMGRSVKKKKAHIGDALGDVLKDLSFDAAIQNLTDQVAQTVPPSVRKAIEKGQKNVNWTFAASLKPELDRLSKEWGFTVEELDQEVKRRIPAAYKKAGREAEKAARGLSKTVNRSLLDALDDVNFRSVVRKAAVDFETHLTPAMRIALEKGQQVDFTWDDKARKELKALARSMNVSVKDMSRAINRVMQETFEKVDIPLSRFDRGMIRIRNSLRRAGTGGWFDNLTNSLSGMLGLAYNFARVFTIGLTKVGEFGGKVFTSLGDKMTALAAKGGRLAGVLGKAGGALSKIGGVLAKAGGPWGMAIAAAVGLTGGIVLLTRIMGSLVTLVVDLAGVVAMLATGFVAAAAASAVLVPIMVSLGAGMAALVLGSLESVKALGLWGKAMNETDPKKRADLLKQYNEQMKKLGPNAKAAVEAMKPLVKQFAGLKKDTGEALFKGMVPALKAAEPLIAGLRTGLEGAAGAIGNVIDKFLRLGSNKQFMEDFNALWTFAAVAIEDVGSAIVDVFAGLTSFFAAIIPQATEFTGWIRDIAADFRKWAESEDGRERIKTWFTDAWEVAKGFCPEANSVASSPIPRMTGVPPQVDIRPSRPGPIICALQA
jgi:BMFP domain-containing protein YqiC